MNLAKKVAFWQENGLITPQQKQAIIDYEKSHAKPYLLYSLVALALFCIGLGFISVVAANWAAIPPSVKLMADFMLLLVVGGAVWRFYRQEKNLWFEGAILLFAVLVLASIGLIAQIYQLQPNSMAAFRLWSLLMIPLTLFCRKTVLPFVVLPVLWTSLLDYAMQYRVFLETMFDSWAYSAEILWLFLWFLLYQTLRLFLPGRAEGFLKALRFWLIFSTAGTIFCMEFSESFLDGLGYHVNRYASNGLAVSLYHVEGLFGSCLVLSAALMVAISFYLEKLRRRPFYIPVLMLIVLAGGLLPLGFLLSFATLTLTGIYAYQNHSRKLFNLVSFLAALRIFCIYVDVFGSLMLTGIGLIVSGFVLLFLIWGTSRLMKLLYKGK